MSIRIVSKRKGGTEAEEGEYVIYIGRPSVLGNPKLLGSEANRAQCLAWYTDRLRVAYAAKGAVYNEINRIAALHRSGLRIALQCWCAPAPCHGDSVKEMIERLVP